MATFRFLDYDIYYEVHGIGKPLVICNGIMMSTNSWSLFVSEFSLNHQLILFDFLDQGRSSCMSSDYDINLQSNVLKALLDHLNIFHIDLVGISYGGEVAQIFASNYPHYVDNLVLANTVCKTNKWLCDIGNSWNEIAFLEAREAYYYATIPIIYSHDFYVLNFSWMEKRRELLVNEYYTSSFFKRMIRLTNSASLFDVSNDLKHILCNTLVIGGAKDVLTPLDEQKLIVSKIKNSRLVVLDVGHASMYEDAHLFSSVVLGFLQIKKEISVV